MDGRGRRREGGMERWREVSVRCGLGQQPGPSAWQLWALVEVADSPGSASPW